MENKTRIPIEIEEGLKSEANSLVEILKKAVPEHTHVLPYIYALELLLLEVISTQCNKVPQLIVYKIVRGLINEIIATQQRYENVVKDTPDENQEPEPQP